MKSKESGDGLFEQWQLMEKFYYDDLGIIVAIFIVFAIVSISTISHLSYLFPKVVNSLFLIFLIASSVFIYHNYKLHGELMSKAKYVNPANREFKRNFYRDQHYSNYEKVLYRNDFMGDYFEAVGLYDDYQTIQEIDYLGRDAFNYHYFDIDGSIYLTIDKWIQYSDQHTQASRVGVHYRLTDTRLSELGFVSESRIFFQHFLIPTALIDLSYQAEPNIKVHQHRDIVVKWVAPS